MSLLDVLLLLPLALGLIRGLFNGLIRELISIVAIFLAIFLAYHYSGEVETLLQEYIHQDGVALKIISYLLIFGAVMLLAFALSFILTKLLQIMALGLLNRVLGGAFGLLKSLLILLILIHLFQPYIHSSPWYESFETSIVYTQLKEWSILAAEWLSQIQLDESEKDDLIQNSLYTR